MEWISYSQMGGGRVLFKTVVHQNDDVKGDHSTPAVSLLFVAVLISYVALHYCSYILYAKIKIKDGRTVIQQKHNSGFQQNIHLCLYRRTCTVYFCTVSFLKNTYCCM